MKTRLILLTLLLFSAAAQAQKPVNRYDLLGRLLVPLASVFNPQGENRAISGAFVLESMSGVPQEWKGARLDVALLPPDRFLLRGTRGEESLALCRNGKEFWMTPGSEATPWRPQSAGSGNGEKALAPIALPFPPQQLALLPVLFEVNEAEVPGPYRALSLRFMPMLAQKLKLEAWEARLLVDVSRQDTPVLRRIELHGMGWHLAVRVEGLAPTPTLPEATWEPTSPDVLRFSGAEAEAFLQSLRERVGLP